MLMFASLAVAIAAGVFTYLYPLAGLLILIACNPFDLPMDIAGMTVYTNQLLLLCVFAALVIRKIKDKSLEHFYSLTWVIAIGIFIVTVFISTFNAEQFSAVVKQLLRWMEIVIAAWIGVNTIRKKEDIQKVVIAILAVTTVASVIGIVQTLAGPDAVFNQGKTLFTLDDGATMRAYSSMGHPNQFAGYLLLMIPIAFIQFIEVKDIWKRTFVGLLAIVMITALIFTFSRGGWLAMLAVGGVLIYLNIPKKILMIVSLILALAVTVFILNQGPLEKTRKTVMQRMVSFSQPEREDSVNFRGVCYKTALKMFKQHPLTGYGAGEYERNIRLYFDENYYAWEAINKHIHNLYVQILIEIGILGLLAFLGLLAVLLVNLGKTFLSMVQNYERQILSAVIGAVMAFLIHNCFDVLTMFARGVHFGLIAGLGLAIGSMAERTTSLRVKAE